MPKADVADTHAATRARLDEIERELAQLQEQRSELKAQWQLEKDLIGSIRSMKSQIEGLKTEAANYERQGDLAKVAEIRYGKITDLEKKLVETNRQLEEAQSSTKMLKEEVDADDIAEVVSKWTGRTIIQVRSGLHADRLGKILHAGIDKHTLPDQNGGDHALAVGPSHHLLGGARGLLDIHLIELHAVLAEEGFRPVTVGAPGGAIHRDGCGIRGVHSS